MNQHSGSPLPLYKQCSSQRIAPRLASRRYQSKREQRFRLSGTHLIAKRTRPQWTRSGVARVHTLIGIHGPLVAQIWQNISSILCDADQMLSTSRFLTQRSDSLWKGRCIVRDGTVGLTLVALPAAVKLEQCVSCAKQAFCFESIQSGGNI